MNKIILVFFTLIVSTALSFGQNKTQPTASATATDTVRVSTIQCGSCKMAIEKALKGLDGVKSANVDLKKKIVAVEYVALKLDLSRIEAAITEAGYAANDKKADPEAYAKLDECCKVPEDQQ